MCQPALPKPPIVFRPSLALALASLCCGALVLPLAAVDSTALRSQFADPPRQYSSAPLWVWNDMLTEEQIIGTLRDLAGRTSNRSSCIPGPA